MTNCKNCGAPLRSLTGSYVCEYCGTEYGNAVVRFAYASCATYPMTTTACATLRDLPVMALGPFRNENGHVMYEYFKGW